MVAAPRAGSAAEVQPVWKRHLWRILLWGSVGLVLVLVLLAWLLLSTSGLRFALSFAPDTLKYSNARGQLWSGVELDKLRFSQDGLKLSAERVKLTLDWPALRTRTIRILQADVQGLSIMQSPLTKPVPVKSADSAASDWRLEVVQISGSDIRFSQKSAANSEGVELLNVQTLVGKSLLFADQQLQISELKIKERRALLEIAGALDLRTLAGLNDKAAASSASKNLQVKLTTSADFDEILAWPAPIVFDANVSGDRRALQIGLLASLPFDLALQAKIEDPLAKARWNASIKTQGAAIGVLARTPQFTNLSTDLIGSGDLSALQLSGKFALDDAQFQLESLDASVNADVSALALKNFKIVLPNLGWLSAAGVWPLQPKAPPGDLNLAWQNLALPVEFSWPPELSSAAGTAQISGYLDALGINSKLKLSRSVAANKDTPASQISGDVVLDATISPTLIDLRTLTMALETALAEPKAGQASLRGQVLRKEGALQSAQLKIQAMDFDPSLFAAEFPGLLALDAALDFSFATGKDGAIKPTGALQIDSLSGALRERPISGKGGLTFANAWQPAGALDLRWGNNQIKLRPQANADLQSSLDLQELALFEPRASGSVQGDVLLIADALGNPVGIDGAISARLLSFADLKVQELELKLQAPAGQNAPIALALDAIGIVQGKQEVERAQINVSGTRAQHSLSADVQASQGSVKLAAAGSFTPGKTAEALGEWRGMLNTLSLQPAVKTAATDVSDAADPANAVEKRALPARSAQVFTLTAPSALQISSAMTEFANTCFNSSAGLAFCLSARWPNQGAGQATLTLSRMPMIALLDGLADAPEVDVSGALSGAILVRALDGQAQQLSANLAQLEPVKVTFNPEVAGDGLETRKTLTLKTLALNLQAQMQDGAWRPVLDGTLELQEGLSLRALKLALAPGDALSGRVELKLADLAQFNGISDAIGKLSGSAEGAFDFAGTLQAPLLSGDLKGARLSVEIPELNITLKEGDLSVAAAQDRFVLNGKVKSGTGFLEFSGAYAPKLEKERLSLIIKGDRVLLADIPSARIIASPNLTLTHDGTLIRIKGTLDVPEANIQLDRFESAVTRSNDVVIIDAPPVPPGAPIRADVAIVLGSEVKLKGFGLNGKLAGSIKIRERPNKPSTGRGEIQVTGTYKAYGQDLLIERGRLLFAASPLEDPGLDIRAVRKIDKIKAGVQVRGTAAQPELTVWSDPVMEQSEVLSYIVLGRGLKGTSGADSALVNQAANALGTAGGNLLAKGIGQRIGLELGVETLSEVGGPAFTAGRYLSPRLYVGYGQGLFNPQTIFILRYKLFDSYEVEALSGREQKIGVNYRRER